MNIDTPLINGVSYGWADISVTILGITVIGITAIEYKDDQEMENHYGKGRKAVSRGYGQIKNEASISLLSEEVVALQKASPTGRLQDIKEFDVVVAYQPEDGLTTVDIIKACRFKTNERTAKTGDMKIECKLPLIVGDIEWDA